MPDISGTLPKLARLKLNRDDFLAGGYSTADGRFTIVGDNRHRCFRIDDRRITRKQAVSSRRWAIGVNRTKSGDDDHRLLAEAGIPDYFDTSHNAHREWKERYIFPTRRAALEALAVVAYQDESY